MKIFCEYLFIWQSLRVEFLNEALRYLEKIKKYLFERNLCPLNLKNYH